jgi:predicted Ser/Thr protein kinase
LIGPVRRAALEARDTLLVYYCGHGHLDDEGQYSVSLTGSRSGEPWTSVPFGWIKTVLMQTRAKNRLVILDSCFSGKAHGFMSADPLKVQVAVAGAAVISSASNDSPSLAPIGERYTAFTGELISVLTSGIEGGPAEITVDDAFLHVKSVLASKGRPRPARTGTDTSGALVVARNVRYRPPPMPRMSRDRRLSTLLERLGIDVRSQGTPPPRSGQKQIFGGRYQVRGVIGRGGMGSVYLATDIALGRNVAVKTLVELGRLDTQELLTRESRAVATLNHPAIGAIYDIGSDGGERFFVMEYIEGVTLDAIARPVKRIALREIAEIIFDVLSGLEHAHLRGVVHRDIKPHNIMITDDGRVKILDFGIAYLVSELDDPYGKDGMVVGTPVYMAPETLKGLNATAPTADIYAVGVVLYELCTWQSPYSNGSFSELFRMKTETPPEAPSSINPSIPPEWDALIMKAMSIDPADRYQSAASMRADLETLLDAPEPTVWGEDNVGGSVGAQEPTRGTMEPARLFTMPGPEVTRNAVNASTTIIDDRTDPRSAHGASDL